MRAYDWEHQIERRLIRPMLISYNDAHGEHSYREIIPISLAGYRTETGVTVSVIAARCKTARARRSFRVERIAELVNAESGEPIDDITSWLASLVPGGYPERQQGKAVSIGAPSERLEARELRTRPGCGLIWWLAGAFVVVALLFLLGAFQP